MMMNFNLNLVFSLFIYYVEAVDSVLGILLCLNGKFVLELEILNDYCDLYIFKYFEDIDFVWKS